MAERAGATRVDTRTIRRPLWRTVVLLDAWVAATSIGFGASLALGVIRLPLAWLPGAPLSDYTLLGAVMAIAVGGSALAATAVARRSRRAGLVLSVIAGVILAGCEVVEVTLIDPNVGRWLMLVAPLQATYSAIALAMIGLPISLWSTRDRP